MAVAFDNVSPATSGSSVSSLTSAAYAVAGANRYKFGCAGCQTTGPADSTNMKWGGAGGTGFTKLATGLSISANTNLTPFGLLAPTAASQTLFCDWAASKDEIAEIAASYTGVDQATPLRNSNVPTSNSGTASGTSVALSVTVPNTVSGDMVTAMFWVEDDVFHTPSIAAAGGSTLRRLIQISIDQACALVDIVATGTSTVIQATATAGTPISGFWGGWAVALVPAATGTQNALMWIKA